MPNSYPEGRILYPHQTTMIDSFSCIPFDFNVGGAINESRSYTLTSVICDVAMTSTPNVITTELRDLLYNQCIYNTCCYSFLSVPRVG